MRIPELVAHRGWARRFPENTLAALEAAIDAGARRVEVDVQLTRDGVPVLFHDRTLARICGAGGAVHDLDLESLRRLPAAETGRFGERFARERVATLEELAALLARHREVRAFVEAKRIAIERFGSGVMLGSMLRALEPAAGRCALISFSLPFLAAARSACPLPIGAVFDRWPEQEAPEARALAPEFVFCDVEGLPAGGTLSAGASRIAVWEVDDPRVALDLAARGVDLVETMAIGEMIEGLRERGAIPG